MKLLPHISKNIRTYNKLIQHISHAFGAGRKIKTRKMIYNLGTCFEAVDLVNYKTEELSDDKFLTLSRLHDTQQFRNALDNIMIPRVVGTPGHRQVRTYIKNTLEQLQWTVNIDEFHENVPIMGRLQFKNIIATLNPNAERFLVLSCHYDSKYMPDYEFLGATDSAVPCAMLINLAQVLHDHLTQFRNSKLSLMLLFFDGEEAFENWGPNDSIYGARHLAKKWETEQFLDKIDMLVLLDLIGAPDPEFYSFFPNTEAWHSRLIAIEERLSRAGMLERYTSSGVVEQLPNRYFQPNAMRSSLIEDDHIPFLRRNVPILHVIPLPFPSIWHTKNDDFSAIDYVTTENISRIIRLFAMEYLLSYVT